MIQRIVLFGASGDLAARLLMPAVAQIAAGGLLPSGLSILGSAVTDWTPNEFRDHMAAALDQHASSVAPDVRRTVVEKLDFRPADVTNPVDVKAVIGDAHEPTLVYLALPTGLLERTLTALSDADLTANDAVAIEKPFGTDLTSAQRLNEILRSQIPKPTIFRIDHFLSNELVRRILALRFANRVFEPLLCAQHVERVDISYLESLTLEGRASYYDGAGALKDMVQNHLLETLSLVVMEQPARLDDASFRGNRVEALRAVATPTPESIRNGTIRARYAAGTIGTRSVPAYVEEPGVDPSRNTETYAAIDLEVPSSRWYGTRFTLRSGKALARDSAEIAFHFKKVRGYLSNVSIDVAPNVLRIGLMKPYVRLETTINGPEFTPLNQTLEMLAEEPRRKAYANLIVEMLNNRPLLFIRGDEAEEAWRVIDPIATAWANDEVPMQTYPAGGEALIMSR
jgi:glucose-6-phosphate 1-dehydrogenase